METTYFYLDESFRKKDSYWHCNIGGMLLKSEHVVDVEIAIETQLFQLAQKADVSAPVSECKYSDFLRTTSDEFKFEVCRSISLLLVELGARFLISHAKCRESQLSIFKDLKPELAIQELAHFNIVSSYLADLMEQGIVQIVVDLGLSEAFRPVYRLYSSAIENIPKLLACGWSASGITIPNFTRLPPPVFMDSKRSRILQFSDLVIGLLLCKEIGALSKFKESMLEAISPLVQATQVHSIEWNKNIA